MKYSRMQHWQFLEDELKAQTEEFKVKFDSPARQLLDEKGEMFVGFFESFHNGSMVVRLPNSRSLPRKGAHLLCMLLPRHLRAPSDWGTRTFRDLYAARFKGSDCTCVFHGKADDSRYSLVGFNGIDVDFAKMIEDSRSIILVFAPQYPPLEYVANLQKVVRDERSAAVSSVLDAEYKPQTWKPKLLSGNDDASDVMMQMSLSPVTILQGPPGTGKTHAISKICAELCAAGKSVLVTALTNRALVEIAAKSDLAFLLAAGKVSKVHLTVDEAREVKGLRLAHDAVPLPGEVLLSTFYMASGCAAEGTVDGLFDYVIMDEASQAFTAMFAAALKLGKTNLWVGDIKQLPPVVMLNPDRIEASGYQDLIDGLRLISCNREYPVLQLTKTHRLGSRAAAYTGIFYDGTLVSACEDRVYPMSGLETLVSSEGGPSLVQLSLPLGDDAPRCGVDCVISLIRKIRGAAPGKRVAVLSHKVRTVVALQKAKAIALNNAEDVLVETVARVQGLTTDIAIYFVPSSSYRYSLECRLFNVATSRAKEHTFIIVDRGVFEHKELDGRVLSFLTAVRDDTAIDSPPVVDLEAIGTDSHLDLADGCGCELKPPAEAPPLALMDVQLMLDEAQDSLCRWLGCYLPKIFGEKMWSDGVLNALFNEQRVSAEESGAKALEDLDFASLISVFVGNARALRRVSHLNPEMQELAKLVKRIRNHYAHKGAGVIRTADSADIRYHMDTLKRFAKGLSITGGGAMPLSRSSTIVAKGGITISVT